MTIIPIGKKVGNSSLGPIYQNFKGLFFLIPRSLLEIIEARVTNGRGYVSSERNLEIPYAENPLKKNINPEIFCYARMDISKFFGWNEDVREGHPDDSCGYHQVISL